MMCEHMHVEIEWTLWAMQTLYEPAEYVGRATCLDCGEQFSADDVPEDAEVIDA
jgi:hypothetical protein